ncbi:MAG: hypothetical protein IKZ98_03850 [Clostridia bacterium]|nr:hypothetical protein [Clostridia bacterium]
MKRTEEKKGIYMKKNKIMAMGLAALMALSAGSACADVLYFKQNPIPARIVRTVSVTENEARLKGSNLGRLYVRHYLWSDIAGYYGASHYTNFFQAIPGGKGDTRYGGDWMAPDSANYIRSNSIQKKKYGVAARANTKYADDGFATIRISGYMDPNA